MTFVKERLTQCFPMGYFKDINLASEIAYVNVRRRLGRNTLNEMSKLERPFMTITPQIQPPSGDMYLYDIPLTKNFDNMEYGVETNTLFPIIKNKDDGYTLTYKLNRDKVQFEVIITIDTLTQQLDLYKYLVNQLTWERPFTVKTCLESMIPREIIKHMGFLSQIDIDNPNSNQIPIILQMLNQYTKYPITYKMRNGTALDEFFMYYGAEILLTYEDLSLDGVSRKGFADDYYQIRFNVTAEFNLPGVYMLLGSKPRPRELDVDLKVKEHDGYHDMIPLYTINNFYSRYPATKNGYLYYTSTRFQTECAKNVTTDHLDITSLFEDWHLEVIHRYQSNRIPMETLIDPILIKDGVELTTDWDVDWAKMQLNIYNADDKATYCLVLYINNNLFSEEYIDKSESTKVDKPRV
jgi:hypothetical protein